MKEDPEERWTREVPFASVLALVAAVKAGCLEAHQFGGRFKRFPKAQTVGQVRYGLVEENLARFGDEDQVFESVIERHPGGTTSFVALISPGIRITLEHADSKESDPQQSLFRDEEQDRQLSFLDDFGPLVLSLVYGGVDADEPGAPGFIGLRVLDGHGGFMPGIYIDLLQTLKTAVEPPPIEAQADERTMRSREEDHKGKSPNKQG